MLKPLSIALCTAAVTALVLVLVGLPQLPTISLRPADPFADARTTARPPQPAGSGGAELRARAAKVARTRVR